MSSVAKSGIESMLDLQLLLRNAIGVALISAEEWWAVGGWR